jgi:hypothetical protein
MRFVFLCSALDNSPALPPAAHTTAAAPTNCSSVPSASLSWGGSWPSSCAGLGVGTRCNATCLNGGDASVVCQADGQWDVLVTGSCIGEQKRAGWVNFEPPLPLA